MSQSDTIDELFAALSSQFKPDELEWRVQRSGIKNNKPWAIVVPYVQNRAIMDRLDEVVGLWNWRNEFKQFTNGIVCGISIKLFAPQSLISHEELIAKYGESVVPSKKEEFWLTKWDGAPETNIEAFKGGLSDAMKRAAVHWGMGRYLYRIEMKFAEFVDNGKYTAKIENSYYKWNPPYVEELTEKPAQGRSMADAIITVQGIIKGLEQATDEARIKEIMRKTFDFFNHLTPAVQVEIESARDLALARLAESLYD